MKTVILISGKIGSGKNAFFELMKPYLKKQNIQYNHVYFAKYLKDTCFEIFERYAQHLNSKLDLIKEISNNENVDIIADSLKIKEDNWYENKNVSTRLLLQNIGTDLIVNKIDTKFWVHKLAEMCEANKLNIVTDFRFPEEYNELKNLLNSYKIITIRVNRNKSNQNTPIEHISETSLDTFKFDIVVDNNDTLESLQDKAKIVIKEILNF